MKSTKVTTKSSVSKSHCNCTNNTKQASSYRGVRQRQWGRWVSEIREPRKKRRIWLGSYKNAEMAARAHDVASFYFKGDKSLLNFPEQIEFLPRPSSSAPKDIQTAASQAAVMRTVGEQNQSSCDDFWREIELPELLNFDHLPEYGDYDNVSSGTISCYGDFMYKNECNWEKFESIEHMGT